MLLQTRSLNTLVVATTRLRLIATLLFLGVLVTAFVVGCGPRVVLVQEDSPVRTGEDVRGHVYARVNGNWVPSRNRVAVPEGWYLVPPSFVESDQ